jgi:hypothetical protein
VGNTAFLECVELASRDDAVGAVLAAAVARRVEHLAGVPASRPVAARIEVGCVAARRARVKLAASPKELLGLVEIRESELGHLELARGLTRVDVAEVAGTLEARDVRRGVMSALDAGRELAPGTIDRALVLEALVRAGDEIGLRAPGLAADPAPREATRPFCRASRAT